MKNFKRHLKKFIDRRSDPAKKINGVEHALVKWAGYNKKCNQWIPMSDVTTI